jgi:hypothetical protein
MDSSKFVKKLEKIVSASNKTKDIAVGDIKLTIRLMTSYEELLVQDAISQFDGLTYLLKTKHETLSYSICKIDGEELPEEIEVEGGIKVQKGMFLKNRFLSSLPQTGVDSIFQAYLVLQLESQEDIKKSVIFENSDLIEKYMEDQNLKKAQDTLDKMVDQAQE